MAVCTRFSSQESGLDTSTARKCHQPQWACYPEGLPNVVLNPLVMTVKGGVSLLLNHLPPRA